MKKVIFCAVLIATITSCNKNDRDEVIEKKKIVLSDTSKSYHAIDIYAGKEDEDPYTYFDLDTNKVLEENDLTSDNWDIAFNATTIKVNGGDDRKGKGGALVLDELYDDVEEVPKDSKFNQDKKTNAGSDEAYHYAIPMGSGNGWYIYDQKEHKVAPNKGRTIVVRTGDGKRYAKIKILSYYKGNPKLEDVNIFRDYSKTRYYTFDYVLQTKDGEHKF